jgi:hypothetical protein
VPCFPRAPGPLYKVKIENVSGTGKGSVNELPLYDCTTSSPENCTVKSITPEAFPWPVLLQTFTSTHYIKIEGVKVSIVYAGAKCALGGLTVKVTGTAGGRIDNTAETATFDEASFAATSTELKALSQKILWPARHRLRGRGRGLQRAYDGRRLRPRSDGE